MLSERCCTEDRIHLPSFTLCIDVDVKGQRFIGSIAPNTDSLPLNMNFDRFDQRG